MTTTPTSAIADHKPAASSGRVLNFSAGPATMPEEVLRRAQEDIWNKGDSGIGIIEHSHRGPVFTRVLDEAIADCRTLANIGADHEVLFVQGGATLQFAMIPMNFLPEGRTADYLDTGVWTTKAIEEAKRIGRVYIAFAGGATKYDHTPQPEEITYSDDPAYVHYCSNNTIYGTRYSAPPITNAPLISDSSSEILSRPIDLAKHAMIYAGAQKNLGPAGVVLVIIRKDLLESGKTGLPLMLDYKAIAEKNSCLNTPPTFSIYFMGLVFKWILDQGGLIEMERRNKEKAALIYDVIDRHAGFYTCVSRTECRSDMNISFRTPTDDLDKTFITEAGRHDMSGLKGHRNVGGLRASIYNAFPRSGCETLAQFMADFAQRNG